MILLALIPTKELVALTRDTATRDHNRGINQEMEHASSSLQKCSGGVLILMPSWEFEYSTSENHLQSIATSNREERFTRKNPKERKKRN